jgi:hypothetical protein
MRLVASSRFSRQAAESGWERIIQELARDLGYAFGAVGPSSPKNETPPENKPAKVKGGKIAATLPSGYSGGEGQKQVSKAYKDNWNVIFAEKKR